MNTPLVSLRATALLLCLGSLPALAPAQNVKPPKAQLWMDVSTGSMPGMPEMDMPGVGSLLGGMMGGGGGQDLYGMARGMNISPPRVLDIALYNRLKPGVEAAQSIPLGMRMGERLPLLPFVPQAVRESEPTDVPPDYQRETPKGRILIYWGCGATVRPGQPRVIDLASGNPAQFAAAFAGRYAPDRGARVGPGYALFPNEKNRQSLPRDASLVGEHRVLGDGVPPSMKFTLGAAQDLLPAFDLQLAGGLADSVNVGWRPMAQARAYYLHAMGQAGENDMVMWSSAETPDTGMGMFDFLSQGTIERWLKDKVLLPPETVQCEVPKGIFSPKAGAGGDGGGAMLRIIAYGNESNFAHPPRPADPKAVWEPDWSLRVRVKSHALAMLGEESSGGRSGRAGSNSTNSAPTAGAPAQGQPSSAADALNPLANPANLLKGLFGR
ncbi:MAG: hypothetical protein IAE92_05035 [Burkholderiaceae bacterium]|nr:hypothetical protein [Burkholderiaceae bacterium]